MEQQSVESIRDVVSSKLNAVNNWSLILQGDLGNSAENTAELSHSGGKELGCIYCHQLPSELLAKVGSSHWRKLSGKLLCVVKDGSVWMEMMS